MLFKGSHPRVFSQFRVQRDLHWASLLCRIPPWLLKYESTSPAVEYAWRENYFYRLNVQHPYRMMPSESPHPGTSPVVRNVWCFANRQNQQKRGPSGNFQFPPGKRWVSILAGDWDSSQGGRSVASIFQGQNSTPSSSFNNSRVADITQHVTSTPSTTQWRSINTPTAKPFTPAPGGTSQTDSTRHIVSSPASSIASTPTPVSGLDNLPTRIPNPEALAIITNPL